MKLAKLDFVLLAVILYFTFIGGTFYSQLHYFLRVANQIIVTGLLGGWLIWRLKQQLGLPRTSLDAALGLYLAAGLLSAIFGQSARFSFESLWLSLAHVLAFYLLVDLARRGYTPKLVWAFYMASAVVCLVGLAEFAAWYAGVGPFAMGWFEVGGWRQPLPPVIYRLNITLNGSTPLANYLSLLITPALALVISLPRRDQNRPALLVWLALAVPVEILTFSRTGVIGLGVSLLLLLAGWLVVYRQQGARLRQQWTGRPRWQRWAALLVLLLVIVLAGWWLVRAFTQRTYSIGFRFNLWQAALQIFQQEWLLGVGPGNFGRALLRLNDSTLPRQQVGSAHNIYLNTAAELGLVGLLAGATLYYFTARSWLAHWRRLTTPAAKIRLIGLGAALAGLAVQLLADSYAATPNILVTMALLAGVVAPLKIERPSRFKLAPAALALAVLLASLAGWLWLARADWHYESSFRREQAGNLPEAVAEAEQVYQLDPALALRLFRLALLEARLAHQSGDVVLRQAAIDHYQTGLAREPILGLNSANLAALLWQNGQQIEAIDLLTRTVAVESDPQYWLNLGYFFEQQADWESAARAYGHALGASTGLAASPFWQQPPRAEHWPAVLAAAESVAGRPALIGIYLARRDDETLAQLLTTPGAADEPSGQMTQLELALRQHHPLDPAVAAALTATLPPHDYFGRGQLARLTGDAAMAERLLKTAVFLGDSRAYYPLGQLYQQQNNLAAAVAAYRQALLLSQPENIEVIIYGRLAGNEPVPQLVRLAGAGQIEPALALIQLYQTSGQPEEADSVRSWLAGQDDFFSPATLNVDSGQ